MIVAQLGVKVGAAAPRPAEWIVFRIVCFLIKEHVGILCLLFDSAQIGPDEPNMIVVVSIPQAIVPDKCIVMSLESAPAFMHDDSIQLVSMVLLAHFVLL